MKKLVFLFAALLCGISASAQYYTDPVVTETQDENGRTVVSTTESKNVLTNDFKYNWELIGLIGTQFYYGDNDKYMGFWERFTFPAFDIMLNKWASPSIGFALGVSGVRMKGIYQSINGVPAQENYPHFITDEVYEKNAYTRDSKQVDFNYQKGNYINPYIVAMFDLSNLFGGVRADRFYTAQWYAGGGVMLGFDKDKQQLTNARGVSFNTGLLNKFRLSDRFDFVVNLRGALVSDEFDGECQRDEPYDKKHMTNNTPFDGIFGATAGLCLHFGVKKNLHSWKKASDVNTDHFVAPVIVPKEVIVHDTIQVGKPVDPSLWFHIQFKIDKTDIQPRERININSVADFIKSAPDTKFLVCGFADKQTSYPAHNMWLSEHRAQNVYDMLVNEFGVNPDQLQIDYKGGVDYMFYTKEELSRCVMIVPLTGDKTVDDFGERELKN